MPNVKTGDIARVIEKNQLADSIVLVSVGPRSYIYPDAVVRWCVKPLTSVRVQNLSDGNFRMCLPGDKDELIAMDAALRKWGGDDLETTDTPANVGEGVAA
jgi:hypothetical protein